MEETKPSAPLLSSNINSLSGNYINEKIQANKKFNNNTNNIKDIRNYYETETNNYNKKSSRYKSFINIAEITEKLISSIAATATSTSVALSGIGLPYSIPTAFATATVCDSIIKYSQM